MTEDGVSICEIKKASKRLRGVLHETPLEGSRTFSDLTGSELFLKLENLQKTGSFKVRGAYSKISSLGASKKNGVVTASAGNHAQGVAYAASVLGVKSTIVMPETASPAKIDATKSYGAGVILYGKSFDDSLQMAEQISGREGSILVHPFDDNKVIVGQGTVGLEIMTAKPDLDVVVVPVGGGGLIAGVATAVKAIKPRVRVIGVQSKAFPGLYNAFWTGKPQSPPSGFTLADGISVKEPGKLTFKIIKKNVDDIVLVDDSEIAKAILLLLERQKTLAEPAGAAAMAAVLSGAVTVKEKKCAIIISGGNVDMYTLHQLVSKGLEMEHRMLRIRFDVTDKPGALREIIDVIASARANIIDVKHERLGSEVAPGKAQVILSVETQNEEHTKSLLAAFGRASLDHKVMS
jgi:threonine dehydratase